MLRIGILLSSPSPHQVELLNAVAQRNDVEAFAGYVQPRNPSRHWGCPTPDMPWELLPTNWLQLCRGDLGRWITSHPADVWLLSSVYTNVATQLLARVLGQRNQPFAFLAEPPQPRRGIHSVVQQRLMKSVVDRANAIIGTGSETARRYGEFARPRQTVVSVPYYVDLTTQLQNAPAVPPQNGEPYRFVASAQLIHRKGLDVLIDACEQLGTGGWTLEIFGDGPLRNELERRAAATGCPIYFRGQLPYDQKDRVFRNRHCFVFSTRWDGWGMVLPEALAMGLPVISTDQAMSAFDFIEDGVNGRIVPADDASRLAAAMRSAVASQGELKHQSEAAKRALSDYTPAIGADRLIRVLKQVNQKAA